MNKMIVNVDKAKSEFFKFFSGFTKSSADTLAWLAVVVLNLVFVPSIVAVMTGATDKLPQLDVALIVWTGLLLYFVRSAILRDMVMVVTIGLGFAAQAFLLGLTFFL